MPNPTEFPADLATELLGAAGVDERVDLLRQRGLLSSDGLTGLLDSVGREIDADPLRADALARVFVDVAESFGDGGVLAQARYMHAQNLAERGQLQQALQLIETARAGFEQQGLKTQALRTNFGLIHVLNEMGRHDEALAAGNMLLARLNGVADPSRAAAFPEDSYFAAVTLHGQGSGFNLTGRYNEALEALTRAGQLFDALNETERSAMSAMNRGVSLLALGRADEAIATFQAADRVFDGVGLTNLRAQVLTDIGDAYLLRGDFAKCLETFEEARRMFAAIGEELSANPVLLVDTADAYLALNLYPEALESYQTAELAFRSSEMNYQRARALWGLGATLTRLDRTAEADEALQSAESLFRAGGNAALQSSVLLEQAALDQARGTPAAAETKAREALALAGEHQLPIQAIYARLRLADIVLPDTNAAEEHISAAERLNENLQLPHLDYRLAARRGAVRRRQGRSDEAIADLESAVNALEAARGSLALEALRTSFLRDKTTTYEDLVSLYLSRGDDESLRKAFAIAERAKSRSLVDMIVGLVERELAEISDPEIAGRLGQLRGDLNAIYNAWLGGTGGEQRAVSLAELHNRATYVEHEIQRLRIRARSGRSGTDAMSLAPHAEALTATLPMVAYHIIGEEVVAFVALGDRLEVVRRLAVLPDVIHEVQHLSGQWERFRAGPEFVERHGELLERSARRALETLYNLVMRPVEPVIESLLGRKPTADEPAPLVVVPHGPLHHIPFHALYDGDGYLIDRYVISYAPSATVNSLCEGRTRSAHGRSVVLGVADDQIPGAASEARAVQGLMEQATVFIDGEATRQVLDTQVGRCDVLHVACHGVFRADNPMFSALKLYDGWLTAGDVMSYRLDGALVTLSACESGKGEVIAGDEVMGLTRAFLGAGAASVVVSLWLVQDATTEMLMTDWYGRLNSLGGRAEALRAAQIHLRSEFPHPYYWAPFFMVGQR